MSVVTLRPATASWEAIGTTAVVSVTEPETLAEATATLDRQLRELEHCASRFRGDSEITAMNEAAGSWTRISPLMQTLLREAVRAAEISGGVVDPAVGWALIEAGYDRDWRDLDDRVEGTDSAGTRHNLSGARHVARLRAVAHRVDWRDLEFSADGSQVRIPSSVRLDLGATAKAYAADRAAADIARSTGSGVLVSLGGDIATAGSAPDGGWQVRVTDDHRSPVDAPGQTVAIHDGALATSSTTVRRWRVSGTAMHHIIDPRTNRPAAASWRTVSATAATCIDANIATTTAIVLGEQAPAWLERAGIAARLVSTGGEVLTLCGWPEEHA